MLSSSRFRARRVLAGASSALLVSSVLLAAAAAPVAASATTVVVKPGSLNGWQVQHASCGATATGASSFVTGPDTPPAGDGSLRLEIGADGDSFEALRLPSLDLVRLDALTTLEYSTYSDAGGTGDQAPYLLLNIDTNGDTSLDDQLFFEPEYQSGYTSNVPDQGALTYGTWHTWDALAGGWWSTSTSGVGPGADVKTIAHYLGIYPDARIVNASGGLGGFRIVAGCGGGAWVNFDGNVDELTVGFGGADTVYDFEPTDPCSSICYVDAVTGNDANDGASPSTAKRTIQAGVNAVDDGGTVVVAAGTYDEQVEVEDKSVTIDGAGSSTVIAPSAPSANSTSMFSGAGVAAIVLADAPADTVTVKDVRIDGGGNGPGCMTYTGMFFRGTDGSLLGSQVVDVIDAANPGCQGAIGVFVQSGGGDNASVTIRNNTISGYGKNGITVNEAYSAAVIENNIVDGRGPVGTGDAAQNGIQVAYGATATIRGNTVTDHWYTPTDWSACGLLYVEASGVKASKNVFAGNEVNVCNAGRGGGKFQPAS